MKHCNPQSQQDPDIEWREFVKEVVIDTVIVVLMFAAGVLFMCSLSSCSLTLNVAADGQPNTIIYTDDDAGRCE